MTHLKTTTALAALITAALALPASANHHAEAKMDKKATVAFSDIDINADGEIDFTEYSNYTESKMGMSATDSAVEYVKFANKAGVITEASFTMMMSGDHKNGMKKTTKTMTSTDGMTETMTTETVTTTTSTSGDMMDASMKKMDKAKAKMDKKSMQSAVNGATTKTETTITETMTETMSRPTVTVTSETMSTQTVRSDANKMADYGRFADYDMNADGNVSFAEYSKVRGKAGIKTTKAAQEFMRLSGGAAMFNETRYNMSMSSDVLGQKTYTGSMR